MGNWLWIIIVYPAESWQQFNTVIETKLKLTFYKIFNFSTAEHCCLENTVFGSATKST